MRAASRGRRPAGERRGQRGRVARAAPAGRSRRRAPPRPRRRRRRPPPGGRRRPPRAPPGPSGSGRVEGTTTASAAPRTVSTSSRKPSRRRRPSSGSARPARPAALVRVAAGDRRRPPPGRSRRSPPAPARPAPGPARPGPSSRCTRPTSAATKRSPGRPSAARASARSGGAGHARQAVAEQRGGPRQPELARTAWEMHTSASARSSRRRISGHSAAPTGPPPVQISRTWTRWAAPAARATAPPPSTTEVLSCTTATPRSRASAPSTRRSRATARASAARAGGREQRAPQHGERVHHHLGARALEPLDQLAALGQHAQRPPALGVEPAGDRLQLHVGAVQARRGVQHQDRARRVEPRPGPARRPAGGSGTSPGCSRWAISSTPSTSRGPGREK